MDNQDHDDKNQGEGQASGGTEEKEKPDGAGNVDQDMLKQFLAMSLGLRDKPPSKLSEMSLKGMAEYLASDDCQRVITMAGAGISTSAGIPDFRSPGTGLYDNLAAYDLPHPQAIFDIEYFKENPRPFFTLAKALYPGSFKPTVCHYFIKMLSDKGKLLRHFTQNIDTLERVAGLTGDKVVEAHGTFHSNHCLACQQEYDQAWMKEKVFSDVIPRCLKEGCGGGLVKPDIVFFGENLPPKFAQCVAEDFPACDLLVVMGTSLTVQPFASLVSRVPLTTPRLYINLEKCSTTNNPITALMFGGGFEFDREDNYRDVFHEASCDDGCQELADLLGWGKELQAMVATEHAKIMKADKKGQASAPQKSQEVQKGTVKVSDVGAKDKAQKANTPSSKPKDKSTVDDSRNSKTPTSSKKSTSPPKTPTSQKKSPSPSTKSKKPSPPGGKGKI